jgi:mRNA-degrading endonuclease RelE of RelBE toxin-antitoxin system
MYTVYLSESAQKIYDELEIKNLKKVNKGLRLIEQSPFYYPGKIIPLKGSLKGKYRCREGEWRIIYTVDDVQKEANVEAICTRDETPYK